MPLKRQSTANDECQAKTKAGGPCAAPVVRGGIYCALHADPVRAAQLGRKGGAKNRRAYEGNEREISATEDKNGFYINGEKYAPDAKPMLRVQVGTYQHWRIINQSDELHPIHIHQVHFLAYAVNGERLETPEWLDTVNVSARGTVDVIMDFTNPVIRGMSMFHCHLLNHEDKGMMAKILFE